MPFKAKPGLLKASFKEKLMAGSWFTWSRVRKNKVPLPFFQGNIRASGNVLLPNRLGDTVTGALNY